MLRVGGSVGCAEHTGDIMPGEAETGFQMGSCCQDESGREVAAWCPVAVRLRYASGRGFCPGLSPVRVDHVGGGWMQKGETVGRCAERTARFVLSGGFGRHGQKLFSCVFAMHMENILTE